jgi:probable rRNA maturation factor
MSDIVVDIVDLYEVAWVDKSLLKRAVRIVLSDAGVAKATISIAIVDDAHITRLNRQFLQHDYATDVLSFALSEPQAPLEGEVIVSAETAQRMAARYGWEASAELLWYVIHGSLHLVGYDDVSAADQAEMRRREAEVLGQLGIALPDGSAAD